MKIGYSESFQNPINGEWKKQWIEEDNFLHGIDLMNCSDEEIERLMKRVRQLQYAIKNRVSDFRHESTKHDEKTAAETKEAVLDEDGKTIADIMLCNDLVTLKTFEFVSSKTKAIKAAYTQKFNQLTILKTKKLP